MTRKKHFSIGRTNIETLAILAMAVFMTGMLGGVIFQAGARLWTKYQYFFQHGSAPEKANITVESVIIVGALVRKYSLVKSTSMNIFSSNQIASSAGVHRQ